MIREHKEGSYEGFLEIEFDRFSDAVRAAGPSQPLQAKYYSRAEFAHWVMPKEFEDVTGMDENVWLNRKISRARYAALK
jgi:hypothetical protein